VRWHPRGFGGERRPPEVVRRDGWLEQGVLVIGIDDRRLTWPERELLRQLGTRLFGPRPQREGSDE
jgi:hypothetical protein